MKKSVILVIATFLFAGNMSSSAYLKGQIEGKIIKQSLFGKILSYKEKLNKCNNALKNYKNFNEKQKRDFIKGCIESLSY